MGSGASKPECGDGVKIVEVSIDTEEQRDGNFKLHMKPLRQEWKNKRHGNKICDFRGVSMRWLVQFALAIRDGKEAPDVQLVKIVDPQHKYNNQTGQIIKEGSGKSMTIKVPFVNREMEVKETQVERKRRESWDTEDVVEFVIKANAHLIKERLFYNDLIEPTNLGKPFQGAFVSQARRTPFKGLVLALLDHFRDKNNLDRQFVWLDMFAANQPLLCDQTTNVNVRKKREELLSHGLHHAIEKFDECLVFFNDWRDPKPLKRAWCVWELYGAAKFRSTDPKIQVIFDPDERDNFISDGLLNDFDSIALSISQINVKEAKCFNMSDAALIHKEIEKNVPGGHSKLNEMVVEQLHLWLARVTNEAIEFHRHHIENTIQFAELLGSAALLRMDQGQDLETSLLELEEALHIFQGHNAQNAAIAHTLNNLGTCLMLMGQYSKSLTRFEESMAVTERDYEKAEILNNIGTVLIKLGKGEQAIPKYEEALKLFSSTKKQRVLVSKAKALQNLGTIYASETTEHALNLAWNYYDRALSIYAKILGPKHITVAELLNNIGVLCLKRGDFENAIRNHGKSLEIKRENLGPTHPSVDEGVINLATVHQDMGEFRQALKLLQEEGSVKKTRHYYHLGSIYYDMGDYPRAIDCFDNVLKTKRIDDDLNEIVAKTLESLGDIFASSVELEKAKNYYREALAMGLKQNRVGHLYFKIGSMEQRLGQLKEAIESYQNALKEPSNMDAFYLSATLDELGRLHESIGQLEDAFGFLEKAYVLRTTNGFKPCEYVEILVSMAIVLKKQDDFNGALELFRQAREIHVGSLGAGHVVVAEVDFNIANVHFRRGEREDALKLYRKCAKIFREKLGETHEYYQMAKYKISHLMNFDG